MRSRPSHDVPERAASLSGSGVDEAPASRIARRRSPSSDGAGGDARSRGGEEPGTHADPTPRECEADYAIGTTIAGRYRIERVVGAGSMGDGVVARHLALDERVAIQFIRPALRRDRQALAQFARDAKALAELRSPHLARLLDVGISVTLGPFIVLEYLEGRDLGQVLREEGPLPATRAVDYVLQACEALAVAHRAGIVHRDIKPETLFLARTDAVDSIRVVDFGSARGGPPEERPLGTPRSGLPPSDVLGTPPPPLLQGGGHDPDVERRADIESLGAVLYELLTARPPLDGDTARARWEHEDAGVPLALTPDRASPELIAIIERCLCQDPARRFPDVGELGRALQPFAVEQKAFDGRRSQPLRITRAAPTHPAADTARRVSHAPAAAQAERPATRELGAEPPGAVAGRAVLRALRRWPWLAVIALAALAVAYALP